MSRRTWRSLFFLLLLTVTISAGGGYIYWRSASQENKAMLLPTTTSAEEIITAVGKIIYLPEGETPTIATVNDLTKLTDQPFFAHAQIGDKVLVYSLAKKAVLYRPSENKVIEIAPLREEKSE